MKKITANNKQELEQKIEAYMTLLERKKELDKMIKEYKDYFLSSYIEGNIQEDETKYLLEADHYELQFELVRQNRFDTTTFKKEHPDEYNKYIKPVTNKVFKAFKKED